MSLKPLALAVVGSPVLERDDLVTHPVCLTGETLRPSRAPDLPFFVDWLTVAQDHAGGGLPEVDAGCIWKADRDGCITWKTVAAVEHEGSYDTHVLIRCDGHRVKFSGNVSRFGRPDNLFGFGFFDCMKIINRILVTYGLPPFTTGFRMEFAERGNVRYGWTGARVSRIDLTANYESGSEENAHAVMQWLGTQHNGRKAGRVLGQGETVDWGVDKTGKGSRRQYWKAYDKYLDLVRQQKKSGLTLPEEVLSYTRDQGIVRFEGTIRSNALTDLGAAYLGDYESGWAMGVLVNLFEEHSAVMSRAEKSTDDLSDLPKHLRGTARDYLSGDNSIARMSRATFYRHRKDLLPYGIDIAMRNVKPFQPRIRVIELTRAERPFWYQLAA